MVRGFHIFPLENRIDVRYYEYNRTVVLVCGMCRYGE